MNQSIQFSIFVTDYDKAIEFYCHQTQLFELDFDSDFGSFRHVIIYSKNNPSLRFRLHLKSNFKNIDCDIDEVHFSLDIDNYNEMISNFNSNKIDFESIEAPYGRQLIINDPFGLKICLTEII